MQIREKLANGAAFIRAINWKTLPADLKGALGRARVMLVSAWPDIRDAARRTPAYLRLIPGRIQSFILSLGLPENGSLRRMTLLRGGAIAFAVVCILGAQNPFGMLVPVIGVDMPVRDSRQTVKVSAYSSQAAGLVTFERRVQWTATTEENVERIAHLLADTSAIREQTAEVDNLPDYGFAIRKVWLWQSDVCIVDLRSSTLADETEAFLRNRNKDELKPRSTYLDAYFQGLTQSILSAVPACKSIQYLLDGKRESIKDMKFDLAQVRARS